MWFVIFCKHSLMTNLPMLPFHVGEMSGVKQVSLQAVENAQRSQHLFHVDKDGISASSLWTQF